MHGYRARVAAAALAGTILAATAAPAGAVVGAQVDTANLYANVAAIEYHFEGQWFPGCSGTLIASDLVLTAAHCVAGSATDTIPVGDVRVNFNPELSIPAPASACPGLRSWQPDIRWLAAGGVPTRGQRAARRRSNHPRSRGRHTL